jgi:predicted DNA-binding protein
MAPVKKSKAGRKPLSPERIHIISIRLPHTIKLALDKCAADDERPNSVKLRMIIVKYLREAGYLK